MPLLYLPAHARSHAGGVEKLEVTGRTVSAAFSEAEHRFPGLTQLWMNGGRLQAGWMLIVDDQIASLGLKQPLLEHSEIHITTALGGG